MQTYKTVLIGVAVVLQAAILAAVVMQREHVLHHGDVVYMRTLPVDPRDLFRGDYVRLGYEAASLTRDHVREEDYREMQKPERRVYLSYRTDTRDVMIPDKLTFTRPEDETYIRGLTTKNRGSSAVGVRFGVEKYFVQQDKGWPMQRGQRLEGVRIPLEMEVAIGRTSGIAVLKGYRYADLGLGVVFPQRSSPGQPLPYKMTVRLANATDEPLNIVDPPDHHTFKIALDTAGRSTGKGVLGFKQRPAPPAEFRQADIKTIMPHSVYEIEIDLTLPPYQLVRGETEIAWNQMEYWESFTVRYEPPGPEKLNQLDVADRLWQGILESRKYYGRSIWQ
jgi:uncharacterized membrane-anchored protein